MAKENPDVPSERIQLQKAFKAWLKWLNATTPKKGIQGVITMETKPIQDKPNKVDPAVIKKEKDKRQKIVKEKRIVKK